MHHRKTEMFINFQQNHVSRSVKTVHTNIFANNRKLHTFATTNSDFKKNDSAYLRHASSYNIHVYQFLANQGHQISQKPCTQIYLQIIASCEKLQGKKSTKNLC